MAEQREEFKQFVFLESTDDATEIKDYLNDKLFGKYRELDEK